MLLYNPWHITVAVNGVAVPFCIDTGAEVTVIPAGVTMNDPACVRERGREGWRESNRECS